MYKHTNKSQIKLKSNQKPAGIKEYVFQTTHLAWEQAGFDQNHIPPPSPRDYSVSPKTILGGGVALLSLLEQMGCCKEVNGCKYAGAW